MYGCLCGNAILPDNMFCQAKQELLTEWNIQSGFQLPTRLGLAIRSVDALSTLPDSSQNVVATSKTR